MERTDKPQRCILLARCSTLESVKDSMEKQMALLAAYAKQHGLIGVDRLLLKGVSSRKMGPHIDALVRRKAEQDDFDAILATQFDRVCRDRIAFDACKTAFDAAGIKLIFASNGHEIGESDFAGLLHAIEANAAIAQRQFRSQIMKQAAARRREQAQRLVGKPLRVLALARSGAADPVKVESQVKSLHQFANQAGMIWVDAVRLAGVGDKEMDKHFGELIGRKRTADDFDTLLIADYSRLTRLGAAHLLRILRNFHRADIRVISFDGDDHNVVIPAFPVVGGTEEVGNV
jgi:DNA invertase Pin-like site-specific DNA recombinase